MKQEIINIKDWGKCLRISDNKKFITTTLDLGPRIIEFGLTDGKNILNPIGKTDPNPTPYGNFYTYGGHRLWHAPEVSPRSYIPDNDPIKYELTDTGAVFYYNFEGPTGIDKKFEIIFGEKQSVNITHTITNKNMWDIKLAPWALTIMAPGGKLLIPNEPYIPHTEKLLPARPIVLWNYTNMADSRWTWGTKFTCLKNDANITRPQKAGFLDKCGWAAYLLNDNVFIKTFDYIENAEYPDYGCNLETFTNGTFHEFETIAPLSVLSPDNSAVYTETWSLFKENVPECEDKAETILKNLLSKIN